MRSWARAAVAATTIGIAGSAAGPAWAQSYGTSPSPVVSGVVTAPAVTTATPVTAPSGSSGATLPLTGGDVAGLVALGGGIVLGGAALVAVSRRRSATA
jgi:LPXTG-motif cell wall-anchored protein